MFFYNTVTCCRWSGGLWWWLTMLAPVPFERLLGLSGTWTQRDLISLRRAVLRANRTGPLRIMRR